MKRVFNYAHTNVVVTGGLPRGECATNVFQFVSVCKFQDFRRMSIIAKKRTQRRIYGRYSSSWVRADVSKVFTESVSNFRRICDCLILKFRC